MPRKQETEFKINFRIERLLVVALLALTFSGAFLPSQAQKEPINIPLDSFLLRVENAKFGRVEASLDAGETYLLLGRVLHPATNSRSEKAAKTIGEVVRSAGDFVSFSVLQGQVLKLRHAPPTQNEKRGGRVPFSFAASEIVTDLQTHEGHLGELLPQLKSKTLLQSGSRGAFQFPDGYAVAIGDRFVFTVPIAVPIAAPKPKISSDSSEFSMMRKKKEEIEARLISLSKEYEAGAIERAKREKRRITSGWLRFVPKLPPNEPEPVIAISYAVDGVVIALHNSLPSVFNWDTHNIGNGEHVVEVRGLSKYDTVVTSVRILIVVSN